MSIKLIAIDLDSTLLTSKGDILPQNKKVIKQVLNHGIKVVLCSRRPIDGLKKYLENLEIRGSAQYVITLNGAIIRNTDDDVISTDLVSYHFYQLMTAYGLAHAIPFNIVDANSHIITANHNVDPNIYLQAYENQAPLYIRMPEQIPEGDIQIAKGCFVGDSELLDQWYDEIKKKFGKDLTVMRTDPHFIELLHPKVNKGSALKKLCQKLNLASKEVMAIGNQHSDFPMLDYAGVAVYMGNNDKEITNKTDYLIVPNDEDGVAQAIQKYVL